MLTMTLLLALGVQQASPVDSLAVYSAILSQVKEEFPGHQIALAETRSGVDCMPLCGVSLRDPDTHTNSPATRPADVAHSRQLMDALRSRGLVDETCRVEEGWYGCRAYPGYLFVALGQITARPPRGPDPVEGGVWIKVALLVPCGERCTGPDADEMSHPEAFGYWYLLQPNSDGGWSVVRRAPAFAV